MNKKQLHKAREIRQDLSKIVELACYALKELDELCGEEEKCES